jgi:hypothetical protein
VSVGGDLVIWLIHIISLFPPLTSPFIFEEIRIGRKYNPLVKPAASFLLDTKEPHASYQLRVDYKETAKRVKIKVL